MRLRLLSGMSAGLALLLLLTLPPVEAAPSTGTVQIAILLADFNDATYDTDRDSEWFEALAFGSSDSMKDYYDENSRGNLTLDGDVFGPYTLDGNAADWGNEDTDFVSDTIEAADDDVDFSEYDAVMAVHPGPGEESSGNSDDIWSIHWSGLNINTNDGNHRIREVTQVPEFEYSSERRPLGVWCHEFGHELGLPDFYDTDGSSEGIGHWGVMASGSWADDGETPVHFSAFSKAEMGWLEPIIVTGDLLDVRLKPASRGGLIIQLPIPGNWSGAREYFMLENRQQLDYDTYLPGEGLLIWHVDEDVSNNRDESHKRLDLEEADGYDDLDNGWNSGDSGDPYSAGDEFTDAGYPNSTAYNLTDSGWRLSDIRKDGDDILLDIRFLSKPHAISDATEAAVDLGEELQFWGHDSWDEDGNLVNYTWDFGDGKFAWIEDPLHTFEDYGTFDVTLTVRDDDGLEAVATLTIYVNAPPVPVIDAQPLELLAGESVSFDGSSSWDPDGTIQFWLWNFDDGATSGDQQVEHVYVQPRSYNVSLKVYDNLNSIATTWVIITVINLEPQVDFAVTPVSANTTVSFNFADNSSDPDGSIVGWTWDFGDGNNSSEQNPQYRYLLPGDYSVTLTAQDNLGAQNSTTQVLAVTNALPLLDFAVPQGVRNGSYWVVPANLEISIAGSGSSDPEGLPLEFAWEVDGVNYFTPDIAVILGTGSHVVSLAITDTHGATVNGNWTLMTVVQPLLSLSPQTVNALTGEMTSFNATVLQGSVTTWEWDGNLTVEGGDVFSFGFVPEAPGSYELRVRGLTSGGLPSPWVVAMLEAFDPPQAVLEIEGDLLQDVWLTFNGSQSQGLDLTWQWSLDGTPLPNATAVALQRVEDGGMHAITLDVQQQPVGSAQVTEQFYLNYLPQALLESLDPARPRIGQEFSFTIVAHDPDGSAQMLAVAWPEDFEPLDETLGNDSYSATVLIEMETSFGLTVTLQDSSGALIEQIVALSVYGWPDGVLQALEWRGSSHTNEKGQFAATVANDGADNLAGTATLKLDGRVLRTWEVTLNPEENITLLAEWTTQPGRHAVTLFLELEQDELELANNQLALNLTIENAEQELPLLALATIALGVMVVAVTAFFYWKQPSRKQSGDDVQLPSSTGGDVEEPVEAIVVEDDAWRRQD